MDDLGSLLTLLLVLMVPAIVVLSIFMVLRKRRGKFHRQRITKKSSRL
jgi:hypothetical protein